jgi:hydrogenase small subunit
MAASPNPADTNIHVLWINAGLSCDGDSVALTAAMQPTIEDIALGALPGLPKVHFHWPLVDYQVGAEFMEWWWRADSGALDPFVLVIEGSIPNEAIKKEGYWCGFGNRSPGASTYNDQPMTTSE